MSSFTSSDHQISSAPVSFNSSRARRGRGRSKSNDYFITSSSSHRDIDDDDQEVHGTMELHDTKPKAKHHMANVVLEGSKLSSNLLSHSSLVRSNNNSCESLVSFFGGSGCSSVSSVNSITAHITTATTTTTTRKTAPLLSRRRSRTLSRDIVSTTSDRFWFHKSKTPRFLRWIVVGTFLVLAEQYAVFYRWMNTEYQAQKDPLQVSASFSASVSSYTATASLQVSQDNSYYNQPWLFGGGATSTTSTSPSSSNKPGMHIVVSHCDKSLDWLWHKLAQAKRQQQLAKQLKILQNIKSITIFSKCHQLPKAVPTTAQVIELPNVGRCDHSYAYWMEHALQLYRTGGGSSSSSTKQNTTTTFLQHSLLHAQDVVWFLKDNDNSYRTKTDIPVSLEEMLVQTQQSGFACASELSPLLGDELGLGGYIPLNLAVQKNIGNFQMYSVYHRENYTVFMGNNNNDNEEEGEERPSGSSTVIRDPFFPPDPNVMTIEDWVDTLPIYNLSLGNKATTSTTGKAPSIQVWDAHQQHPIDYVPSVSSKHHDYYPNMFMPICFGGVFMTTLERIYYAPVGNWTQVVDALSRGDNIEEGHFMERLWAALLSPPMSPADQDYLENHQEYKVMKRNGSYKGIVLIPSNSTMNSDDTDSYLQQEEEYEHDEYSTSKTWWSSILSFFGISSPSTTSHNALSTWTTSLSFRRKRIPTVGIHVVVSHCDKPMDWIWDRLLQMTASTGSTDDHSLPYTVKSITILSKCGSPPRPNELPLLDTIKSRNQRDGQSFQPVQIVDLSKHGGGADHAYAYWIYHQLLQNQLTDNNDQNNDASTTTTTSSSSFPPSGFYLAQDQVLFLRDGDNTLYDRRLGVHHNQEKFRNLHDQSRQFGFACGERISASTLLSTGGASATNSHSNPLRKDVDTDWSALFLASKQYLGTYEVDQKSLQEWVDTDMSSVFNFTLAVTAEDLATSKSIAKTLYVENARAALSNDQWLNSKEVPTFLPVCLGSHFMVTIERILDGALKRNMVKDWPALVNTLGREPIKESNNGSTDVDQQHQEQHHPFMERLWAYILSEPWTNDKAKGLLRQEMSISKREGRFVGMVAIQKQYEPKPPVRKKKGWKKKREPFFEQWMAQKEVLLKQYG